MTTYLLAGGGTAGHVNPLLAVADRLREQHPDATFIVLGTKEGIESRLVPERGYELVTIARLPFPRRLNRAAIAFAGRLRGAVAVVSALIRDRHVDVVIGFGGYAAAPAYLAARRERVPLVIHEANARPGIANRLGARLTKFVGVAFPGTRIAHGVVVGQPLRREIEQLDRFALRPTAREFFGLPIEQPVLLVTGGSSGAQRINVTVRESIAQVLGAGWNVIHVTGAFREPIVDPKLPGYVVLKYCDRMDLALALADLAVGRAGTSTVAELTALGIPAVFVPYPVGNGEQKLNVRSVVAAGGAVVVEDVRFDPAWIVAELVPLLRDRARIADMAVRAASVGSLDGTDRMVALVDAALAGVLPTVQN